MISRADLHTTNCWSALSNGRGAWPQCQSPCNKLMVPSIQSGPPIIQMATSSFKTEPHPLKLGVYGSSRGLYNVKLGVYRSNWRPYNLNCLAYVSNSTLYKIHQKRYVLNVRVYNSLKGLVTLKFTALNINAGKTRLQIGVFRIIFGFLTLILVKPDLKLAFSGIIFQKVIWFPDFDTFFGETRLLIVISRIIDRYSWSGSGFLRLLRSYLH